MHTETAAAAARGRRSPYENPKLHSPQAQCMSAKSCSLAFCGRENALSGLLRAKRATCGTPLCSPSSFIPVLQLRVQTIPGAGLASNTYTANLSDPILSRSVFRSRGSIDATFRKNASFFSIFSTSPRCRNVLERSSASNSAKSESSESNAKFQI